jgi:hypothetical protein
MCSHLLYLQQAELGEGCLNLIKMHEIVLTKTHLALVLEYASGAREHHACTCFLPPICCPILLPRCVCVCVQLAHVGYSSDWFDLRRCQPVCNCCACCNLAVHIHTDRTQPHPQSAACRTTSHTVCNCAIETKLPTLCSTAAAASLRG